MGSPRITLLLSCAMAALAAQQPNHIFIIVDDADVELGSTSAEAMPSLHEFVIRPGLDFTAAHVTSPICCPSRTSLFSGRFPHNLGDDTLGWCGNYTLEREDSILVALSNAGYNVGQVGKWYNEETEGGGASFCREGYVPEWKRGGHGGSSDYFILCQEGVYFNNSWSNNGILMHTPGEYMSAVIGNRSLAFIENATAGSRPWINYVAFQAPHLPSTPAPWHANAPVPAQAPRTPAWNRGWEDKHFIVNNGIDKPMNAALIHGSDTLHGQRLRSLLSVDDYIRDVITLLESKGALQNTFVWFTSDHG